MLGSHQARFLFIFKRARFEDLVSADLTINSNIFSHCKDTKDKKNKGYLSFSHFPKFYTKCLLSKLSSDP